MTTRIKTEMKLGITGGIGSGKTSVCRVFNVLGIPVYSADYEAQLLMNNNRQIKEGINRIAGKDLYKTGILDKMALASLIFSDEDSLHRVNKLVHPIVLQEFDKWASLQVAPYAIIEAAILFESGASELVDRIATVVAPVEERIERVVKRNLLTREQVQERINNQVDDEFRISKSDYVIHNSENDMIIPVILQIHEDILGHSTN